MFWFFGCEGCRILAPWPGVEPAPSALEGEVLTTGPPGKSLQWIFKSWKIGRTTVVLINCFNNWSIVISSVQFSLSVMSDSLRPHEHARPPCPSPTPRVHSNSCPSSRWCHPAVSSSVVPFSSCPQSLPASGSFPMSQLFTWGDQSTGVSALASFLPKKSQGWSPSEWTGWISLQSIIVKKKS